MEDSSNKPDGGISGKLYELNLYLLFLHRGCRNNSYGFKLHREKEDAGKFDDLVFEFQENGATVYRLLQAKHSMSPGKRISEQLLFSGGDGNFDLIKYLVSYRNIKQNYSTKGQIKDFVICTSRSFDFKLLKIDIEKIEEADSILDIRNDDKQSVKYRLKNTKQNFGKIRGEWKKRMNKWEKENDVRKTQPEPDEKEIEEFLNHLIFAVDMPNDTDLGTILKDEIGEEFNEMTRKDIYNRAFHRMIDWMKANDRRNFWTHQDAKAMFEDIKTGFTLPCDVRYNIQPPVSLFTGRNEHLEAIHKLLQEQKRVMISGLGGVGKTELVRKYIEIHSEKYYNNILWINAESDVALENSFRSLASDKLGIKTKNANDEEKNIKVVIEEVYQWFQQSKSLFIFENAEWQQYPTHIRPSLPKNVSEPYIIVTSRRKWKNENIIKTVELSVFTESEAIDFISNSLSKFLNNDQQNNSMKKLAEILHYLPLALTQAIAYMTAEFEYESDTYQIAEYIENFSLKSEEYLDFDFSDYCDSGYAQTVLTTWNITVKALKSKEAFTLDVLNCMSFLLSDNIHTEFLLKLLKDGEKLKKAVRLLNEFSLITVRKKVYSIHRLVQLVTRKKLDCDRRRGVLEKILGTLVENDNIISRNIDHFTSAWTHFKRDRDERVKKYYHVPAAIAFILFDIGRYEEAFSLGIEALELINCFPIDDEERQQCVQNLAPIVVKVLCNSGKGEEALNKSRGIWEILKELNKRFPYTVPILTIENDIATMYLSMRDIDAATKLFNESPLHNGPYSEKYHNVLRIRKEIMGDSSALFHDYHRAVLRYLDLLDERKCSSKASDPGILRISKKSARAIYQMHLYEKAINLISEGRNIRLNLRNEVLLNLREAHEEQKQKLPNNHSERLETQESIICLLIVQEKYEEAWTLFEKISDDSLSRNNCSLLTKKATALALLKKSDRALTICEDLTKDILKLESADFKINYPDVVDRCVGVALVLSLLGKFDEALNILGEIWDRLKHSVSFYNVYVARILIIIGHIYLMQGKRVEGLSTFKELWECYNNVPILFYMMPQGFLFFTDVFFNERQLESALRRGLTLIEIYKPIPEFSQQLTWRIKRRIARLFVDKEHFEKALSMLAEVKKSQEAFLKKDDPDYQTTCDSVKDVIRLKIAAVESNRNEMSTTKDPFVAVKSGNLEQLEKLITDGADVNAADENKWTLLHHAASVSEHETVHYLLQNGADATRVTGKFRNTALHIAVTRNDVFSVDSLLNFTYDRKKTIVNAKTKASETTALHIASRKGFPEIARLLLAQGAAYDAKNKAGKTPLEMARGIFVEALLREVHVCFQSLMNPGDNRALQLFENCPGSQYRAVFRARNSQGHSLFKLTVANNCKTLVESILALDEGEFFYCDEMPRDFVYLLLQRDETISSIFRSNCIGRIEYAERIESLLKPLRRFGTIFEDYFSSTLDDMYDILAQDKLANEVEKLVKFVVEELVKKIFKMFYGAALLDAARLGNMEAFKLCLGKQPILYMCDVGTRTAFHYAAEAGNETMIELLLDKDINGFNKLPGLLWESPFHLAAKNGHVKVANLLLRTYCRSIHLRTRENRDTALHLAAKNGHLEMVKLLLENNAVYGTMNNAGHTPPDLAASQEMKDLFGLIDEMHADEDVDRVLRKLSGFEPAERRPLLNAVNPDGKLLWQVLVGKCTDKKKLLDVIGKQIEVDSKLQAELTRKLLDLMLEVAAKKNEYFRD